ncbi:MAG: leucine-rich repeat protein [Clostridia bacterium]|nr:leucine-rich repeat protein [Clostridia bacterium]
MIERNGKYRLENHEIKAVNKMLKKLSEPFKGARIGDWIDSGGQATVHFLNTKAGNNKYIIKISKDEKGFEKTIDFNGNFADICETRKRNGEKDIKNLVLNVESSFFVTIKTSTERYLLPCIIEKYHPCLKNYSGSKNNATSDDREIATRIGADLLTLLSAMEGKHAHRDIKPGNIFFKTDKLSDGFCLGDFGIVTNFSDGTLKTLIKELGTVSTASPDIVLRDKTYKDENNNNVYIFKGSTKGDMYSLAVTMYYYLNDRVYPFEDKFDEYAQLDLAHWESIRKADCKPPKHGSQKLKEIVCKALMFNPRNRFLSCVEMLAELKKTEEYRYYVIESNGENKTVIIDNPQDKSYVDNKQEKDEKQKRPANVKKKLHHTTHPKSKNLMDKLGKVFKVLFIILFVTGIISFAACWLFQAEISEGTIGDNAEYTLFGDGKITISGSGELGVIADSLSDFQKFYINQVDIEEGITSVGENAFAGLPHLWSVSFSYKVENISPEAFADCDSLDRIHVEYGNRYFRSENGILYNKDETQLIKCPSDIKERDFSVPRGIIIIGDNAFKGCKNLKSISIPDSVIEIGSDAFYSCEKLTEIELSDNIIKIGINAFFSTGYMLDSDNWEDNALYIGNHLVAVNPQEIGENYSVKHGTTTIANGVFLGIENLNKIEIPDSVKNIGWASFYNTGYYNNPDNRDKNGVLYIGNFLVDADEEKVSGKYTVKEGTKAICDYAFQGSNKLTGISFPDSLTYIGKNAFAICDKLKNADWSSRTKYIGNNAFSLCDIQNINIPSNTVYIGNGAFEKFSSITVDKNNSYYSSDEHGVLFNKEKTRLICFPNNSSLTSYSIPDSVKTIGTAAFKHNNNLKNIIIPYGVENIETEAFKYCSALTDIEIPASVCYISDNAFVNCISLNRITVDKNNSCYSSDEYGVLFDKYQTELILYPRFSAVKTYNIPDSVSRIKNGAFRLCIMLEEVVIPATVYNIEHGAFDKSGLTAVTVKESNPNYTSDNFGVLYNKDFTELLYYPCNSEMKNYEISDRVLKISSISSPENLTDIYYSGTQEEWENISSDANFGERVVVHYNS